MGNVALFPTTQNGRMPKKLGIVSEFRVKSFFPRFGKWTPAGGRRWVVSTIFGRFYETKARIDWSLL